MIQKSRIEALARDVFSQVRTSIVMKMRFLDMAVFRLKPFPAEINLATDGNFLYYDPIWLLKRYSDESSSITRDYMHVLLHCIFRHPFVNTLRTVCWNQECLTLHKWQYAAQYCDDKKINFTYSDEQ